jgi:hypothetical protein
MLEIALTLMNSSVLTVLDVDQSETSTDFSVQLPLLTLDTSCDAR